MTDRLEELAALMREIVRHTELLASTIAWTERALTELDRR